MRPEALIVFVCALVAGFALGTLIATLVLRWSISMYNAMAGQNSAARVPEPSFGHAIAITLVASFIQLVVTFVFGFAVGFVFVAMGGPSLTASSPLTIAVQVSSIPISFLVTSWTVSCMLPTTFMRAVLITLCQVAIVVGIGLAVGVLIAIAMVGSAILGG